ncbi:MAG: endolytic transglycosylase MltG [bacterium]|nr:endolytic transglycosylase MltG [bacterium]
MYESNTNLRIALVVLVFALALGLIYFSPQPEPPKAETVRVTIPEGFTVRQIAERLEAEGLFPAADFMKLASADEGFLFPDTYEFFRTTAPERVILKMKDNFSKKVGAEVSRDVIIMASLLEEEAKTPEDKKIVAGILWKRLESGAALRVDATLTYITGRPSRELTDGDLKINSPYNTYRYPGLPAGPISNPGLETIDSALHPAPSPYWFYLSDKDGKLHYARTFEEHKANRLKYLQ